MPMAASIFSDFIPRLRRSRTRSLSLPAAMRCLTLLLRIGRRPFRRLPGLEEIHDRLGQLARAAPGGGRDQVQGPAVAQATRDAFGARLGLVIRQQVALVDDQPTRLAAQLLA